jgi:DNA-binding SARP family transcriptional activator
MHPRPVDVRLELLGGFRVVLDGRVVRDAAWPSRRSAELVQLLALAPGRRLLRDQVCEALWPHLGPDAGAANLRKAAHHARQVLGSDGALVLSGGAVALFPGTPFETDAERFERLASLALRSGDRFACDQAASAYAGDLLPTARYEGWTFQDRDRLRGLHVALLRALHRWERVVELEPADEQAHRELMRGALVDGNRSAAIHWYGRLRTALAAELGLAPDSESRALYAQCLIGLERSATPFVGRQLELARTAVAIRSAEQGRIGALVMRGSAGLGKSALCRQVAVTATERGWSAVTVAASYGGSPYAPLVDAVVQLTGRHPGVLDGLNEHARCTLAELTKPAGAAAPERGLTRHLVVGAVRRLFTACGSGVLLVVDDAHLADEATIDACVQLARAGAGPPCLVVLAYRREAARPQLVRSVGVLERAERVVEVDLGPLDREDVVALASAAAGTRLDAAVVAEIARLAHGNPFFTLELTRAVGAGAGSTVPPSAWAALTARCYDFDDTTADALRRLAVAGDEFDPADVPALTGQDESSAFAVLDAALESGALTFSGGRYRFRHELVRRALIEQIAPHSRLVVHRETAERLARAGAAPALIARHWLDGRRADEATPWLLAASRQAVALGAYADALTHLEQLVAHEPAHADGLAVRAAVLDALGDARAPTAYAAAAQVAGAAAQDVRAQQALAQLKLGDPPGALLTVAGLEPVTVAGRLAQALTWSGAAALGFAEPGLGTAQAAECRRLALETGDTGALVVASWAQAAAAHARGDLRGSLRADLRDTHALRDLAVSVFDGQLCITQRLLYGAQPYPGVIAFADSFAAEAQRLGAARGLAFAVTLRGEARLLSGDLVQAEEDLIEAGRLSRAIGAGVGEALALQRRAELAAHQGSRAVAMALLDEALAVARESDVGFHLFDRIYGTRVAVAGSLAAVEEAEGAVQGPTETCPGCRITLVVPAAIAAAQAGDLDRARLYAQQAEMLATVVMRLPAWSAAVEEVDGHLLLASGDDRGATSRFRIAAQHFSACGQPLDEQRCTDLVTAQGRG